MLEIPQLTLNNLLNYTVDKFFDVTFLIDSRFSRIATEIFCLAYLVR